MICLNCGSDKVSRNGDEFQCAACKYEWDVAHEKDNAVFLRSQGRRPAKSVAEIEAERRAAVKATEAKAEAQAEAERLKLESETEAEPQDGNTLEQAETPADDNDAADTQKPKGRGKKAFD